MRKVILVLGFISLIGLGLLFPGFFTDHGIIWGNVTSRNYTKKYSDCISGEDLHQFSKFNTRNSTKKQEILFKEIDDCLSLYEKTLDSNINRLNSISAHNFLHTAYREHKKLLLETKGDDVLESYYHYGAMKICHEKDKLLNLETYGMERKLGRN